MWKTFDFDCKQCHKVFEEMTKDASSVLCDCGGQTEKVWTGKAPGVHGCDSFNPHYDEQLGQHFSSAEQKKDFLKKTGRTQISGSLSPKKSGKSRYIGSASQSRKTFGKNAPVRKPNTSGL